MDLEQIQYVIEEAERNSERVIQDSVIYTEKIDIYSGNAPESETRHYGNISYADIVKETFDIAESVERHREIHEDIKEAYRGLKRKSDHLITESGRTVSDLETDLENLDDLYRANMNHMREVFERVSKLSNHMEDEELTSVPDPYRIKSDLIRDKHSRNDSALEILEELKI